MKDSTIALSIASVVTVLAGASLYYGTSYVGHGSFGHSHGKNYYKGHYGGHSHHVGPYHVLRFKDRLGLTEDQVVQFNNLKSEQNKKKIEFQKDHKIAHLEIEHELNSDNMNENKVRKLASKIGNLKRKDIEDKFEGQLNVIRLLTTEQKKTLKQIHENPSEGSNRKIK